MHGALMFILVVAIFIVVAPLFWCGVIFLISRLSGWSALADHYATSSWPSENQKKSKSLQMRRGRFFPANYNMIVQLGVDRDAIYLSLPKPFRPFHPVLRLPFDDLKVTGEGPRKIRIRFWQAVDVTFMREPSIEISFRKKDYDRIVETRQKLTDKYA